MGSFATDLRYKYFFQIFESLKMKILRLNNSLKIIARLENLENTSYFVLIVV